MPAHGAPARSSLDDYLDRVIADLASRGDDVGIVRLVERWVNAGEPTRYGLIAQARALLRLRLMDRVNLRLTELAARDPDDVEMLVLLAELHIQRGWPVRARKPLGRLRELGAELPGLAELEVQADSPPLQPDPNAREIERTGTPADQLLLAERFIAAGSFLRAKAILERLRRLPDQDKDRIEALLWGIGGEHAKEQGDPMELARILAPGATMPPDDDTRETTESLPFGLRDGSGGHDESALGAFPTLFRRQDDPTVDTDTAEEHTSVSIMADAERAQRHEAEVDGDGDDGPAVRDGDTQIMLVIRQDGGAPGAAPASGHRLKEEQGYNLRETLNLREYQASMGMSEPAVRPAVADDAAELEEEDADLIVMTRREVEPGVAPAAPAPARPVEVVHKPIVPLAPPSATPPAPHLSPAPTPATMASRAPPPASRPSPSGSPTPPPRRAPKTSPKAAVAPAGEASPTVRLLPGLILVALLMAALGLALVLLIARLTG